jgi:hypothetical protein
LSKLTVNVSGSPTTACAATPLNEASGAGCAALASGRATTARSNETTTRKNLDMKNDTRREAGETAG